MVSHFRAHLVDGPISLLWMAIVGPGAFIMERRMLFGIEQRAESSGDGSRIACVARG